MDNFSAESEELGFKKTDGDITPNLEGEDIEFDEDNIDIDEIQKKLQAHMAGEEVVEISPEEIVRIDIPLEEPQDTSANTSLNKPVEETAKVDAGSKKYVIYIDPENIEIMEGLSINDRKTVINSILKEHDERRAREMAEAQRKRFMRHVIIATLTFIIGFPLLFIVVNKAMEISIVNYNQAQRNFSTLYKDGGKIQQSLPNSASQFKY